MRYDCLEPLELSITAGAQVLGVSRQALNNLVNGRSAISPEMAIRLDKAFGGGAEVWLRMHGSLKSKPPISRLALTKDNLLRLHT